MRVIIAGGREVEPKLARSLVYRAVTNSGWTTEIDMIISGGATGIDLAAKIYAIRHDFAFEEYPADWEAYGKSAGPIRNAEMAENADGLIAIWDGKSSGTKNMIETARCRGLRVYIHNY